MGWNSWDNSWRDYGANRPDYSNILFFANPEDLKKEIAVEDIGKEMVFMENHAYCETCDKDLKAFVSEAKAKAHVDKHLGYKKYAGHNAYVKKVDFSEAKNCTVADITGTKANIEKLQELRKSQFAVMSTRIQNLVADYEDTINNVQITLDLPERKNEYHPEPKSFKDGSIFLWNKETQVTATITFDDLESIKKLFDGTWDKMENPYERASMLMHLVKIDGYHSGHKVYSWDYPVNYAPFVIDQQVGECSFCNKTIESWDDMYLNYHNRTNVHRDCLKHAVEADSLEWYVTHGKYAREQEELKQKQEVSA